jgi:hypothetical protein
MFTPPAGCGHCPAALLEIDAQRREGVKTACTVISKRRTTRGKQAQRSQQILDHTKAKAGRCPAVDHIRTSAIGFNADQQPFTKLARHSHAAVPVIPIASAGIDRINPATKHRPLAHVLLRPNRQQRCDVPGPQTMARGRQRHPREHCDLNSGGLIVIKVIFDRSCKVTSTPMVPGLVVGKGHGQPERQLHVLDGTVIDLSPNRPAEITPAPFGFEQRRVDFPTAGWGRLGIVGQERRACPPRGGTGYYGNRECNRGYCEEDVAVPWAGC